MIDLHTHTLYSDGSYSVKELLEEAQKKRISILSITDHNTVDAYNEFLKDGIRQKFLGKIITGVEITTTYRGEIIEVLGYGFDLELMNDFLKKRVYSFEEEQMREYDLIKNCYRKKGLIFDEKNIQYNPKCESSRIAFCNEIKRYPENFKYFFNESSITTDSGFTRNEVYNPKSPLYVDHSSLFPNLEEVIQIIHQAGGVAILAHTFAYSKNIWEQLDEILDNYQLDGLECYYTTFTSEQSESLIKICNDRGLIMSGGSDFHGTRKVNHNLGIGRGNLNIPEKIVKNWKEKVKEKTYIKE